MWIDTESYLTVYFAEGEACLRTFDIYIALPPRYKLVKERQTWIAGRRATETINSADLFRWCDFILFILCSFLL